MEEIDPIDQARAHLEMMMEKLKLYVIFGLAFVAVCAIFGFVHRGAKAEIRELKTEVKTQTERANGLEAVNVELAFQLGEQTDALHRKEKQLAESQGRIADLDKKLEVLRENPEAACYLPCLIPDVVWDGVFGKD